MNCGQIIFVTPGVRDALVKMNINLIEPSAYGKLRNMVSTADLGFAFSVDQVVRDNRHLSALGEGPIFARSFRLNPDQVVEFESHIRPYISSEIQKEKTISYLNGEEIGYEMNGGVPYTLSILNGALVVALEPGFFNWLAVKDSPVNFYRNCLEMFQNTVPNSELTHSALFEKFVQLSISF